MNGPPSWDQRLVHGHAWPGAHDQRRSETDHHDGHTGQNHQPERRGRPFGLDGELHQKSRAAFDIRFSYYTTHESCEWSDVHGRWLFLRGKASSEPFVRESDVDETKGLTKRTVVRHAGFP